MTKIAIDALDGPKPEGGYAQATRLDDARSMLFVSGQIPVAPDGTLAGDFASQARQAWANVFAQLRAADMGPDDLVKVTIFLSDRRFAEENRKAREEALGGRRVALTVVIADIFDPAWLLEIEAVAAR